MKSTLLFLAVISVIGCASEEKKDTMVSIIGDRQLAVYDWDKNTLERSKGIETEDVVRQLIADLGNANTALSACNEKLNPPKKSVKKK